MLTHCDKCHSEINDGRCSCGVWVDDYKQIPGMRTLEAAIELYNFKCDQHNSSIPMSGDHHSGTCYIFFKGDYIDCMRGVEFIKNMNN